MHGHLGGFEPFECGSTASVFPRHEARIGRSRCLARQHKRRKMSLELAHGYAASDMDHPRPPSSGDTPVGLRSDRFTLERLALADGRHLQGSHDAVWKSEHGVRHAISGSVVPLCDVDREHTPKDLLGKALLIARSAGHVHTVARTRVPGRGSRSAPNREVDVTRRCDHWESWTTTRI